MTEPILRVTNLRKSVAVESLWSRSQRRTLWHIPEVATADSGFYVVAGRNGCGKSTFLRCLLGLLRPDSGTIAWWHGRTADPSLVGYLPEFPVIPPAAKVSDWLSWLLDLPPAKLLTLETELARFPTLAVRSLLDVPANRLSKGQQQRVQLWAALARSPQVLVLDEPFSGLDPWARVELGDLLVALLSEGRTIFMSTHELPEKLRETARQTWTFENETLVPREGCTVPR